MRHKPKTYPRHAAFINAGLRRAAVWYAPKSLHASGLTSGIVLDQRQTRPFESLSMPRPKLKTNDDILDAANLVLLEKGGTDFTLADVARKVDLSRAALIQRFGDRQGLLHGMAEREVTQTRAYIESLPLVPGADGLKAFLAEIVGSMGDGKSFSARVHLAWAEANDPQLRAHANQRYGLVQEAIAARLPEHIEDRTETARLIHAIIAGATMQWIVSEDPHLGDFVITRLEAALETLLSD